MPSAGAIVAADDFTQGKKNVDGTDETAVTTTTYAKGGTTVGVTFTAPTSGRVLVLWHARIEMNTFTANSRMTVSAEVATGTTIGSGTVISGADDDSAIETPHSAPSGATPTAEETRLQCAMFRVVEGLTAGSAYNAYVMHKVFTGNGDVFTRSIAVTPLP